MTIYLVTFIHLALGELFELKFELGRYLYNTVCSVETIRIMSTPTLLLVKLTMKIVIWTLYNVDTHMTFFRYN